MSDTEQGQVNRTAAQIYDDFFLPALFQEWAGRILDVANVQPGQRVLDVACGTGVLARAAAERVGSENVVGLDLNEGMLNVARQKAPDIEWRHGRAEELPFDDGEFDAVVSQFGLMFFEDRQGALREMARVLRPGGRLAVAVWGTLENSPGYMAMTHLLHDLFGEKAANELRAPFVMGDPQSLRSLFAAAQIPNAQVISQEGTARFPSLDDWLFTEIKGWTLADMVDDAQFEQLRVAAQRKLQPFVNADGAVAFAMPAHIVTATKM